ncbi:MAG: single-stranded DNA-binding protein [Bacteroidales bacterium]|nr:single-stranded DNA-binding protein [Bacteroidales bacterium]
MEQINKIELRGLVGAVRIQEVGERKVAHFTVATSLAYTNKDGMAVIETQWHNVNAWEGRYITCLDQLKKGDKVGPIGRLRYSRFTGEDGQEHNSTEILAYRLVILQDEDMLAAEM